jgi:hypothetical protein
MHHDCQHYTFKLVGFLALALIVGLSAGRSRVQAQSLDDLPSAASDPNDIDPAISNADPVTIDTSGRPDAAPDSVIEDRDDSGTLAGSDKADVESVASSTAVVAADTPDGSESSAVLELPQVVDLANMGGANTSPDSEFASSDDSAQPGDDGQDADSDRNVAAAGGNIATLQEYENQANAEPMGPVIVAPIITAPPIYVVRFPRPLLLNPPSYPRSGVLIAPGPIMIPPTSSGPFPSTSPMLMRPYFAFRSFPHRSFTGIRR